VNQEPAPPPPPDFRPSGLSGSETIWVRALNLMRKHPGPAFLPLLVTQLPFAVITAGVFFYLFYDLYPDAEFDSFNWLSEAPNGLRLTMVLLGAAQSLFSLVGAAATMVAVSGVLRDKPIGLAQSLDPAFTRMGGLLVFGLLFNFLLLASIVGFFVLLYFVIRFGVVIQAYVLDEKGVSGAFGESWRLMRGRMFKFMGLVLTAIPLGLIILLGTSFLFALVAAPFGSEPSRTTELAFQSFALFVVIAAFVPVGAYLATSTTMFYLSAREESHA